MRQSEHLVQLRKRVDDPRTSEQVLLISMPFGPLFTPSIGLSLIAAELQRAGFVTDISYFTVSFAKRIGVQLYALISSGAPSTNALLGEWLFRDALFGAASSDADELYARILQDGLSAQGSVLPRRWKSLDALLEDIVWVRSIVDDFLECCAHEVVVREPLLVGFTSVFQQNVASLALAKRIKALRPATTIAFGGANCESVMGEQLLESFPDIDFVISGEGEAAVVDLVKRLATTNRRSEQNRAYIAATSAPVQLDALPYPDYGNYFQQIANEPEIKSRVRLLFETSRGCWWGEQNHCTFCGLNGTSMRFRSKTPARALSELRSLTSQYPGRPVSVVDNIIDHEYFSDFLPMLEEAGLDCELFYEVKANLTKAQVAQLSRAKIRRIQPGIESLHDGPLQLMKKGVSAIQNIQLLKWCAEYAIEPLWNLLAGFPGENPQWYEDMAQLVPHLHHLRPPDSLSILRLDRFSPLFNEESLGARRKRPLEAYSHIYSGLTPAARERLAYHFDFDRDDRIDARAYVENLEMALTRWQSSAASCAFFYVRADDRFVLFDLRHPDEVYMSVLDDVDTLIYSACERARAVDGVLGALTKAGGVFANITTSECMRRLDAMTASNIMLASRNKYLSLATAFDSQAPSTAALQRFQSFLEQRNISHDSEFLQLMV